MENVSKTTPQYEVLPGTRKVTEWPFSRDSIWNTPIGDGAVYELAGLKPEPAFSVDKEIIYTTTEDDEYLEICHSRKGRWPDEEDLIHTGRYMYWPKGLIMPRTSGNACCAIIQPDGKTVIQLQPTCRAVPDSKYIVGWSRAGVDLYGGGELGTHWGSGLSSIGGSLRLGGLTSDEPIRHALKMNIWGNPYAYYDEEVPGYRWPADRADSCAKNDRWQRQFYGGINKELCMGSLLALKPELTEEHLKLRTDLGKKLFHALQDYGAYVVDNSAWESYDLSAEFGVVEEVQRVHGICMHGWGFCSMTEKQWDYFHDFSKITRELCVVINNSPDNIGGGGKPRVPLAPDFE